MCCLSTQTTPVSVLKLLSTHNSQHSDDGNIETEHKVSEYKRITDSQLNLAENRRYSYKTPSEVEQVLRFSNPLELDWSYK